MGTNLSAIRGSVHRFLYEAKKCAEQEYGFAALLTAFPVILSISEALYYKGDPSGKKPSDKELFNIFVELIQNEDKNWLLTRNKNKNIQNDKIVYILNDTRNSLAHQNSLPVNISFNQYNSRWRKMVNLIPKK